MTVRATSYGISAKIALIVNPASIEVVDSIGLKQIKFTVNIQDNFIYSMKLNAKSYRKALAKIQELGIDNCTVIISGKLVAHNKIEGAGFQIVEKGKQEATVEEVPLIEEPVVPIITTEQEVVPVVTGRPKLILKRKSNNY
jgi:hypothetical protein